MYIQLVGYSGKHETFRWREYVDLNWRGADTDEETRLSDFNADRRSQDFVCSEFLSASSGSWDWESQFTCERFFRRSGISQAEEEVCVSD